MKKYNQVLEYVTDKLENNNNGHDLAHARRVETNTKRICEHIECQVNIEVCIISSLVHDVIDRKVTNDTEKAKVELYNKLVEIGYPVNFVQTVITICDTISYSKGLKPSTNEAMVVQDADRLDALGLIGAIRTVEYSAAVGRPIYIEGDKSDETAIGHFHSKLYKLKDLMNFEYSKLIAIEKERVLREFEKQYIKEYKW